MGLKLILKSLRKNKELRIAKAILRKKKEKEPDLPVSKTHAKIIVFKIVSIWSRGKQMHEWNKKN